MKTGDVIKWKSSDPTRKRQTHYGVVINPTEYEGDDSDALRVEYTHSVPASNVSSGREMTLRRSIHHPKVIGGTA